MPLGQHRAMRRPVRLILWHMEQPPHRVAAHAGAASTRSTRRNPDIEVKQEPQSWGEIYAKAPAAIAAGNAPGHAVRHPRLHARSSRSIDALASVDDFVNELDAKHDFVPATVAALQL